MLMAYAGMQGFSFPRSKRPRGKQKQVVKVGSDGGNVPLWRKIF